MVKAEESEKVAARARAQAVDRLVDVLVRHGETLGTATPEELRKRLEESELPDLQVSIEVTESSIPLMSVFSNAGMEEIGLHLQDAVGSMFPKRTKVRNVSLREALAQFEAEEQDKLLDQDKIVSSALERAQNSGIIFIDEMDKIAGRESGHGPDVSREGVQRDLLPIVEGTQVTTKYGVVRTDHILFIAAGAFNVAKVSDLIPELQGRFPIRVELSSLTREDFKRILTEPDNSLVKQYQALLATEGVQVDFLDDGLDTIAGVAADLNMRFENIGARRLHTVMEKVLEEVSFHAPECPGQKIPITAAYVRERLSGILKDDDLSRYIL